MSISDPKIFLRRLFDRAVAVADPMQVVPEALPPKPHGRVVVMGAGKASARMAEAVESVWGACEGLVITRYGYARPTQGIEIVEAAHPVPDAAGANATSRLMALAEGLGKDDFALVLISGGGSALLTAPAGTITLDEKRMVNEALLRSGAPIDRMNVVRKHISRVKGGQLAASLHPARALCLMISDVPGDDPADIASGPTVGEQSTPAEAREVVERFGVKVPETVRAHLMGETGVVMPGSEFLARTENVIVAAPSRSLEAAAEIAEKAGVRVEMLGDALEGEARDLAHTHAALAIETQAKMGPRDAPVLLLSGGECTVSGRGAGVGGPNAEYALALALALNAAPGVFALACDTDGVDGAAEVAGAVIGPDTLGKAADLGVDPADALSEHDSHGFFGRIGDQVVTGPTLTNVNDFRAIFIQPATPE